MTKKIKNNAGVTLIEMLVVIALIAVLATAMFPLIKTVYDSWQIADRRVEVLQVGRFGYSKINREIRIARDLADVSNAALVDFYPSWASSTQYRINYSAAKNLEFSPAAPFVDNLLAGPVDSFSYVTYTRRLTTGNTRARRVDSLYFNFAVSDERRILPPTLSPMEFRTFANMRTSREGYNIARTLGFATETFKFSQVVAAAQNVCFKVFCDRIDRTLVGAMTATVTYTCTPGACAVNPLFPMALAFQAVGDYWEVCTSARNFTPIVVVGAPGTAANRRVKMTLSKAGGETCIFYDGIRVERFP